MRSKVLAKYTFSILLLLTVVVFLWKNETIAIQKYMSSQKPTREKGEKIISPKMEQLWWELLQFRQIAVIDYQKALARYGTEAVRKKFALLDNKVWQAVEPRIGWSFFFNVSPFILAASQGTEKLVAFYNPWSDVYLVTVWNAEMEQPKMVDAEILIGDWLRNRGKPPFDLVPLWLRGGTFLPAALGKAVAESARSFEAHFEGWSGSPWRSRIGGMKDERMVFDVNYGAAALMLGKTFQNMDHFSSPKKDEPDMLGALRLELSLVMEKIIDGDLDGVFASTAEILPSVKEFVRAIPVDRYQKLTVVSTVVGREDGIAFLIDPEDVDYCLSFYFRGNPDHLALHRIDAIYYPGWYEEMSGDDKKQP